MARITVVIFILSTIVFCIDAEMNLATLVHNVTRLEKRAVGTTNCNTARYKTVSLTDFIYKDKCFPNGWDDFLNVTDVKKEIDIISSYLYEAVQDKEGRKMRGNKNPRKYPGDVIEPPMTDMFNAFTVPLNKVKVVILGQDPTPQEGKATGMAFSLKPDVNPRDVKSVFNILTELEKEGVSVNLENGTGDLTPWKGQGVLLLNAALTVKQKGQPGTHQKWWEKFTELLVDYISENGPQPCAWILWGNEAQKIQKNITAPVGCIITGGHPSPVNTAVPFFGGKYFIRANQCLKNAGRGVVYWHLP